MFNEMLQNEFVMDTQKLVSELSKVNSGIRKVASFEEGVSAGHVVSAVIRAYENVRKGEKVSFGDKVIDQYLSLLFASRTFQERVATGAKAKEYFTMWIDGKNYAFFKKVKRENVCKYVGEGKAYADIDTALEHYIGGMLLLPCKRTYIYVGKGKERKEKCLYKWAELLASMHCMLVVVGAQVQAAKAAQNKADMDEWIAAGRPMGSKWAWVRAGKPTFAAAAIESK